MKAHFIGIKGVGMTALALIFKDKGWRVSGSDLGQTFITDQALHQAGIKVFTGFSAEHLDSDLDLVVYSGAYRPDSNPELKAALAAKFKTVTQQQALAQVLGTKHLVAVAGVGGKTTTSALLAHLFRSSGRDVGYFLGAGQFNGIFRPGSWGKDNLFVAEADEYANNIGLDNTPKLLLLQPTDVVLPNLQYDHPDIYSSPKDTLATFKQFLSKIPPQGKLYYNADSDFIEQLISSITSLPSSVLVGFSRNCDWFIKPISYQDEYTKVQIFHEGKKLELKLLIFGSYNVRNAVLAGALAYERGLSWDQISQALSTFKGVGRRQEFKGQRDGALFYDDYGHHPAEIKATLQAFKQRFPQRRIWVFFESHTYSRTQTLLTDFITSLSLADKISIMPIFSSAREKASDFSLTNQILAQRLRTLGKDAQALSFDEAPKYLDRHLKSGDLILTMGAGLVYQLHTRFLGKI